MRTKKHVLQPADLHLITNLVGCSETFKTAEGWAPICLPHYDPRLVEQGNFGGSGGCSEAAIPRAGQE